MNAEILDDPEALEAADPGEMLRAVASSGAQVRQAVRATHEAGLASLAAIGRPRSIVVAGMGGSGISGDALAAVAGPASAVQITTVRGYTLPGWVGAADLVIGVSCSGGTEETVSVVEDAVRRGCPLVTVGSPDSMLAELSRQARGLHIPVDAGGRLPRANIWTLSIPLLVVADALGVIEVPAEVLDATADLLDIISGRCRPASESFVNPAKLLATELAGTVPMLWGSSELAAVAAYRFACQLNENTKYPAVFGSLPEVNHNQVVAFDGPFGGLRRVAAGDPDDFGGNGGNGADGGLGGNSGNGGPGVPADFFADRAEVENEAAVRMRLVLLRDSEEHPQVARRRTVSQQLAEARELPVSEVIAEGDHRLQRLASLVAVTDYASVYLALALGIDPTPIEPIVELKERIAR